MQFNNVCYRPYAGEEYDSPVSLKYYVMGIVRFLLAISVVLAHSPYMNGRLLVGGANAVQLFFLISGYLISFVLVERKTYPTIASFYLTRWIRLWPLYLVAAIITIVAGIGIVDMIAFYKKLPADGILVLTLSNILMFGQDTMMFLGIQDQHIVFLKNFRDSSLPLYRGLVVPQGWSLGIEVVFYSIAPFVLKRLWLLLSVLLMSTLLRLYLIDIGLGLSDPWSYRFFPTELSLFLLGALSHQFLAPIYGKLSKKAFAQVGWIATTAYVATIVFSNAVLGQYGEYFEKITLLVFLATVLPAVFSFTRNHRWDTRLGELSYPIYVVHFALVLRTAPYADKYPLAATVANVVGAVLLAVLLEKLIGHRIEKFRDAIKRRIAPPATPIRRAPR